MEETVNRQRFQLPNLVPDLYGISAGYKARLAGATSFESSARCSRREHFPRHPNISVLHRIHMRPHQHGYIDLLGAILSAFAALLAKLRVGRESLIGQELFLFARIGQVTGHRKILFEMFVRAETRNGRRNKLVIQRPLQQSRLAHRRQFFGKARVWPDRTSCLGFHRNDSHSAFCRFLDRGEDSSVVSHRVVQHYQPYVEQIQSYRFAQYLHGVVRR